MPGVSVRDFSLRARGTLTPDVSGTWQVAMASTGSARLEIDGLVVIDNARPVRGLSLLMGDGDPLEATEVVLEAGRPHELVVEFESGHSAIAGFQLVAARPAVEGSMERATAAAQAADVAVVVVGSNRHWETEGRDRADLRLVGEQDELVRRVAAANPNTVVVVNAGSPVEMPWAGQVGAVLMLWYPGEEGASALARLLTGAAEPAGRLPITFPARLEDSAAQGWYPGTDGKVVYGEGTLVGYRHFDARGLEPAFCFGHGLSYTSFDYGAPSLTVDGRRVGIALEVTNSGARRGSDVVQVYVGDVEASVPRARVRTQGVRQGGPRTGRDGDGGAGARRPGVRLLGCRHARLAGRARHVRDRRRSFESRHPPRGARRDRLNPPRRSSSGSGCRWPPWRSRTPPSV